MTIFFGGGTPSLLSPSQLSDLLTSLDRRFGISKSAEISMEIDPGTFDLNKLQGYVNAGVNRFSLGVQSFDDQLLKTCGRFHAVRDIYQSIDLIHQLGIKNFSIDLISGLPNQTLLQWENTLNQGIALKPAHISCYDLIIEPITPFSRQYAPGTKPLPSEEISAEMYQLAHHLLVDSGYHHYEISNYAKPNYSCKHNQVYWQNNPYYGFGMGAASYLENYRFTRPRTTTGYYEWVNSGCNWREEKITGEDLLLETLMLGLRLEKGVNLRAIAAEFGTDQVELIYQALDPYYQRDLVKITNPQDLLNSNLYLANPEGFLISNTILADLFNFFTP